MSYVFQCLMTRSDSLWCKPSCHRHGTALFSRLTESVLSNLQWTMVLQYIDKMHLWVTGKQHPRPRHKRRKQTRCPASVSTWCSRRGCSPSKALAVFTTLLKKKHHNSRSREIAVFQQCFRSYNFWSCIIDKTFDSLCYSPPPIQARKKKSFVFLPLVCIVLSRPSLQRR